MKYLHTQVLACPATHKTSGGNALQNTTQGKRRNTQRKELVDEWRVYTVLSSHGCCSTWIFNSHLRIKHCFPISRKFHLGLSLKVEFKDENDDYTVKLIKVMLCRKNASTGKVDYWLKYNIFNVWVSQAARICVLSIHLKKLVDNLKRPDMF